MQRLCRSGSDEDLIGRTVAGPRELPVGAVMALIGAPVFIVLLRRQTR